MKSVIRYPGSKWNIADWIISNFPQGYEDMTYLEPFFGSGAVFFKKRRSKIETINDLDDRVVNLFKVIRDNSDELSRVVRLTPWSRTEYKSSYEPSPDPLEDARRFLVRLWQAIGGKTSGITGWSNNIKPIDSGKARWSKLDKQIKITADRLMASKLQIVQIENQEALKLIDRYNSEHSFIYLDPPYVLSTRSKRLYKHEMNDLDHIELLTAIIGSKAKIMISGYDCELYDEYLKGWNKRTVETTTEFHKTAVETIWFNYESYKQMNLFEVIK